MPARRAHRRMSADEKAARKEQAATLLTPGEAEVRRRIIARHARMITAASGDRIPMLCHARATELAGDEAYLGSDGKVIFDSQDLAERARLELEAAGARPMRVYTCDRSRHGHCHLTSKLRNNDPGGPPWT